ncbi:MAG: YggS family pyridoxal phosphate-dependent enzyme [Sphingomonadales bacterium]
METPGQDIAANLESVRQKLAAATAAAGRPQGCAQLVAVSKGQEASMIRQALDAGQRIFGENRVQESQAKWPELRSRHDGIELHLIGPLQTNKVRDALALFDVIETLDRPKLARTLASAIEKSGRAPRLFVQVNTGREDQKAGVAPEDLGGLLGLARDELGLQIEGLMCLPPFDADPGPHFQQLAGLARQHGLMGLSMGMSRDFELAAANGASLVRVGTAIFGPRSQPPPR